MKQHVTSITHNPCWDLTPYLGNESVSSWKIWKGNIMAWIETWKIWNAKLEKIETTFSSFNFILEKKKKITQKILWLVFMDEICLILHKSTGTFCVWVKVPSNEFSTELTKKRPYPCDIAPLRYLKDNTIDTSSESEPKRSKSSSSFFAVPFVAGPAP